MHLIGHSFGGLTVRLLLHYLEKGFFHGHHDTSPDWVRKGGGGIWGVWNALKKKRQIHPPPHVHDVLNNINTNIIIKS